MWSGRVDTFVILEMTTPLSVRRCRRFFKLWFNRVVPVLGRLAGDSEAYTYLPNSVRRFPGPNALAAKMVQAGHGRRPLHTLTAGGIIALHVGNGLSRELYRGRFNSRG